MWVVSLSDDVPGHLRLLRHRGQGGFWLFPGREDRCPVWNKCLLLSILNIHIPSLLQSLQSTPSLLASEGGTASPIRLKLRRAVLRYAPACAAPDLVGVLPSSSIPRLVSHLRRSVLHICAGPCCAEPRGITGSIMRRPTSTPPLGPPDLHNAIPRFVHRSSRPRRSPTFALTHSSPFLSLPSSVPSPDLIPDDFRSFLTSVPSRLLFL